MIYRHHAKQYLKRISGTQTDTSDRYPWQCENISLCCIGKSARAVKSTWPQKLPEWIPINMWIWYQSIYFLLLFAISMNKDTMKTWLELHSWIYATKSTYVIEQEIEDKGNC